MKNKNRLWPLLGALSLFSLLLMLVGFGYGVKSLLFPGQTNTVVPVQEEELPAAVQDGDVDLFAIGDSLTKGMGDASGQGYAGRVKAMLEQRLDMPVHLINFAFNGRTTSGLLEDLSTQGVLSALSQADVIMLTIGGNDLYSPGDEPDPILTEERMPQALERIDTIFEHLTEVNPQAQILYLGLYNPFREIDEEGIISQQVMEWNQAVFERINSYPQAVLVPTFDLFGRQGDRYLSGDHYHPNEEGYIRMAERVAQVLEEVYP